MLIVEKGRPCASIVIGRDCSVVERFAAEELRKYAARMTGASLPIAIGGAAGPSILVGGRAAAGALQLPDSFSRELPDAFLIRTSGADLFLVGSGDRGTLYAVYALLEERLGVRFLGPGEENEEVPRSDRIELPELDDVRLPELAYRCRGSVGGLEEIPCPESLLIFDWMAKNRVNTFLIPIPHYEAMKRTYGDEIAKRAVDMEVGHHDFDFWVPQRELLDEHPEYFALAGGERQRATKFWQGGLAFGTQLCLSNPDTARLAAERIKAYLRANPEAAIIDLWPNDNFGACECVACKALNDPGNATIWPRMPKRSRSYQVFMNRVAEQVAAEFPDQRLSMIAYVDGIEPGEDVPLHPNVEVNVALYRECYAHDVDDPACERNRFYVDVLDKWLALAKRVVLFEYYYKCAWQGLPFGVVRKIFADQRRFAAMGIYGNAPQISVFNFGSLGINYYAFAKAAWDPSLDAGQVMADYCRHYYGPAGADALRFYETLEDAMADARSACPIEAFEWSLLEVFTPELRVRLREAVEAVGTAATGAAPRFERRAGELAAVMEYTDLYCDALETLRQAGEAKESGDAARAIDLLDRAERMGPDAIAFAAQRQQGDRIFVVEIACLEGHRERFWRRNVDRLRTGLAAAPPGIEDIEQGVL